MDDWVVEKLKTMPLMRKSSLNSDHLIADLDLSQELQQEFALDN